MIRKWRIWYVMICITSTSNVLNTSKCRFIQTITLLLTTSIWPWYRPLTINIRHNETTIKNKNAHFILLKKLSLQYIHVHEINHAFLWNSVTTFSWSSTSYIFINYHISYFFRHEAQLPDRAREGVWQNDC